MIEFSQKGDFSKLTNWFEKIKEPFNMGILHKYGRRGVDALRKATPVSSGTTADSWRYEIKNKNGTAIIEFHNDNVINGANIAVILQYGHATRNGGYVQGTDYINPALKPIFDELAKEAWKEVNNK